jgi:hypothetical protein
MEFAGHLRGQTEFLHSGVAQELPGAMEEVQAVHRMDYAFEFDFQTRICVLVVTKFFEK